VAYFVVGPGKRSGPKRHADIPLSMRPYHSDEELETTGMERAMSWGVALAVFASLFLPLYWLIEPTRINNAVDDFYERTSPPAGPSTRTPAPPATGSTSRAARRRTPTRRSRPHGRRRARQHRRSLRRTEIVTDVREFILLTLIHGRAGTPMNAFSVANGGVYSDNQLEQIAAYILSVQTGEIPEAQSFVGRSGEDVFEANCARCHGPNAEGYVGPQLINVFERYGWSGEDDASLEQARAVVRDVLYNGRNLPGNAPMPAFDLELTDDAIEAVIEHIESFQELGGPRTAQIGGEPTPPDEDEGDN
jgi:mono/diheme cytochrome c family protein